MVFLRGMSDVTRSIGVCLAAMCAVRSSILNCKSCQLRPPQASISSSIKPSHSRLNLGEVKIEDLAKHNGYGNLVNNCMKNRLPPLSPNAFEQKLRTEKAFTNGKEDFDRVVNIYNTFFGVVSGSATELKRLA